MVRDSSSTRTQVHSQPTRKATYSKVSTLVPRAPSPDGGPPLAKRARIMPTVRNWNKTNSVAQRLRENTLKLQSEQNCDVDGKITFKTPYPVFKEQKQLTELQSATIRVISQYLRDLGLKDSVDTLVEETGCKIEHTFAAQIRRKVLTGNWDDALEMLHRSAKLLTPTEVEQVETELYIQKCLQMLVQKNKMKAVRFLRVMSQKYGSHEETSELQRLLFLSDQEYQKCIPFKRYSSIHYCEQVYRTIEKFLPNTFTLPQCRLPTLLDKAYRHDTEERSFKVDLKDKPTSTIEHLLGNTKTCRIEEKVHNVQSIPLHYDAYCMEFSPNGKYLAVGCNTNLVKIYSVSKHAWKMKLVRNLEHRQYGPVIQTISWSSDSRFVAICGEQGKYNFDVCVFDMMTGKPHRILMKAADQIEFTAIEFVWGRYHLAVADEFGHFQIHDVSEEYYQVSSPKIKWEGYRIKKIKSLRSGALLALDSQNRIRKYIYQPQVHDCTVLTESSLVHTFAVHKNQRYVAVSTDISLHMWDIEEGSLIRSFSCTTLNSIIIDSCFGGTYHEYLATGTPDGRLLIYHLNNSIPIIEIPAHSRNINSVVWHPKASGLIASSSSDGFVNIWHAFCPIKDCFANNPNGYKLLRNEIAREDETAKQILDLEEKKAMLTRELIEKGEDIERPILPFISDNSSDSTQSSASSSQCNYIQINIRKKTTKHKSDTKNGHANNNKEMNDNIKKEVPSKESTPTYHPNKSTTNGVNKEVPYENNVNNMKNGSSTTCRKRPKRWMNGRMKTIKEKNETFNGFFTNSQLLKKKVTQKKKLREAFIRNNEERLKTLENQEFSILTLEEAMKEAQEYQKKIKEIKQEAKDPEPVSSAKSSPEPLKNSRSASKESQKQNGKMITRQHRKL